MKAYKGKQIIASNVRDCKGFMSAVGLRFKKNFGKYDAYLIHMLFDSILDSFFVYTDFIALWLDKKLKVLKVVHCTKDKIYAPVRGQYLVLELPVEKKGVIKKGDYLILK
ncbi:MAG: hypothetical protein JW791_03670 [Nanoarchaeota archaeon]|nr:hypothetical protein [Nanoarchaeota archaeon]